MSENRPSDPQFVGQADGTRSREASSNEEIVMNAEQQQVVDVMQRAGKKLEDAELGAQETAAGKLKELHGKELVDAGVNMMGRGVWETVKSQLKWTVGGGLVGALVGGIGGGIAGPSVMKNEEIKDFVTFVLDKKGIPFVPDIKNRDFKDRKYLSKAGAAIGAYLGGTSGLRSGTSFATLEYNWEIADKNNLPKTQWVDYLIGQAGLGGLALLLNKRKAGNFGRAGLFVMSELFNPITLGGMRNVATGLWQMRKG